MSVLVRLRHRARILQADAGALFLAARHRDTPRYAKLLIALVVAYALSPVDLIPDFIPVLGYLDDLVLVPLGIALAIRLIPLSVMSECRARAVGFTGRVERAGRWARALVGGVWLLLIGLPCWLLYRLWLPQA